MSRMWHTSRRNGYVCHTGDAIFHKICGIRPVRVNLASTDEVHVSTHTVSSSVVAVVEKLMSDSITLGAQVQRGLRYLVCVSVCVSTLISTLRTTKRMVSDTNGFSVSCIQSKKW